MSDQDQARQAALQAFESAGAFLRGHFVYTSGRHGADYLEKFRILEDPGATAALAAMIAEQFGKSQIQLVAGPTMGGIILAYEVARHLGGRVLRRGFTIPSGTRVLVVDDVVTTGGSVAETQACITESRGLVAGIGVLVDRTGGRMRTTVPYFACLTLDFPSYAPEECPLCADHVPIAQPRGSAKKFAPA